MFSFISWCRNFSSWVQSSMDMSDTRHDHHHHIRRCVRSIWSQTSTETGTWQYATSASWTTLHVDSWRETQEWHMKMAFADGLVVILMSFSSSLLVELFLFITIYNTPRFQRLKNEVEKATRKGANSVNEQYNGTTTNNDNKNNE